MTTIIILCLSVALAIFGAVTVGSYFFTRRFQDAARRASHLTTIIEGKLHDSESRCKGLRGELERTKVELSAARGEKDARHVVPDPQRGSARWNVQMLVALLVLFLFGCIAAFAQLSAGAAP